MEIQNLSEQEWLAIRAKNVTSTESAALFGMSPYLTAYELGVLKSGQAESDFKENERTGWGQRLQDAIAQGIAADYGVIIEGLTNCFAAHPIVSRMGSSFDYRIVGSKFDPEEHYQDLHDLYLKHGPGLLEIKNVDWLVYKNWPDEDLPDHIEIQIQHQLEVSGLKWCVCGVLIGGNRTEIYIRMRDEKVGSAIASRVSSFWRNLDRGVLPPPVLPTDADLIIRMHQYAEPEKVFDGQGDPMLADLCSEYAAARDVAKEADAAQKSLKAKILAHIGTAETVLADGYRISCAVRAPAEVAAYTRAGYRDFRLTKSEAKK